MKVRSNTLIFLSLVFVVLSLQAFSLVRDYSAPPPCTRVVNVTESLNVLINCDSALFMKDADQPTRLVNGQSGYQDRPLNAITAHAISGFISALGITNQQLTVTGNSGSSYTYSTNIYIAYILINLLVLILAISLLFKVYIQYKPEISLRNLNESNVIALNLLLLVGLNEITKTFFWTPHSQLFNLLFPALSIYLLSKVYKTRSIKDYAVKVISIVILTFFYPLFLILILILLLYKNVKLPFKIVASLFAAISYFSYPSLVELLGGKFRNPQIDEFRQFYWPFDILAGRESPSLVFIQIRELILSVPVFPVLVLIAITLYRRSIDRSGLRTKFDYSKMYLWFALSYFVFLLGIGLGTRRLTFGLIVFLLLWKSFELIQQNSNRRGVVQAGLVIAGFQIISWFFSNVPLI